MVFIIPPSFEPICSHLIRTRSITFCSGTHDIRNVTATEEDAEITIQTDYFEHSSASGALFIFVFYDSGAMDLTGTVYLALDRSTSHNHTLLYSLNRGGYRVLAYDIENDGTLASGVGYPAVSRELVISNITQGVCITSNEAF